MVLRPPKSHPSEPYAAGPAAMRSKSEDISATEGFVPDAGATRQEVHGGQAAPPLHCACAIVAPRVIEAQRPAAASA
jgi:hypothetical protein